MASTEKPLITNRTKPPVHESTHPRPLPGGEHPFVGVLSVPLSGGVRGGFPVPLHGRKAAEAEALYMSVTWFGLAALHALASGCGLCGSLYRHPTTTFKAVRGPIHAEPAQILARSAAP